jgi:hypothetical protein
MDNRATVLIIGAGGSVPFGFPTGQELKWAVCDGLADVEKINAVLDQNHLAKALFAGGFNIKELVELRDRLKTSGWESVDEFLAEHKNLQMVGKAAIANVLIRCENRNQLFDPKDSRGNRISNWYQLLFKTVFTPFENIFEKNVKIFTYNYDCSLETYLKETMKHSFTHKEEEIEAALKHIPIIHLHGEFDTHDYGSGLAQVSLKKYSEKIKIVTDNLDDSPQFKKVTDALWRAEEIYFIGFGYGEKNLTRLPIKSHYPPNSPAGRRGLNRPSLEIFGTGYKLPIGIATRVKNHFKNEGFKIQLGEDGIETSQFLRTTTRFGS